MTSRYVDEEDARRAATRGPESFWRWLVKQPRLPEMVGRKAAAGILGVQSPHITRFVRQGRMPEPVEIEGAPSVYIKTEVEAFAKLLREEREERQNRDQE